MQPCLFVVVVAAAATGANITSIERATRSTIGSQQHDAVQQVQYRKVQGGRGSIVRIRFVEVLEHIFHSITKYNTQQESSHG